MSGRYAKPCTLTMAVLWSPMLGGCAIFNSQIETSRRYDRFDNQVVRCATKDGAEHDPLAIYCFRQTSLRSQ